MAFEERVSVIVGHYGSGKTNFSLNLAKKIREKDMQVAVVDLDIVNPYFRTAEHREEFEKMGIDIKAPTYAGSNVDIPAISPELFGVIGSFDGKVIVDVGGDDAGATALGAFREVLSKIDVRYYCVINERRYLDNAIEESIEDIKAIEHKGRIKIDYLINCTNLGAATTKETIENSKAYADKLCEKLGIEVAATAVMEGVDVDPLKISGEMIKSRLFVKPIWL